MKRNKNMKDILEFDIVESVVNQISEERAKHLLRAAVAGILAKTVDRRSEPNLQIKKICEKAQSLMSTKRAQEWSQMIYCEYGVDASRPLPASGPRRVVLDFIKPHDPERF